MSTTSSPYSIDDRIALIRDNLRQLIEQAAGYSGAQDEERSSSRIAQQTAELESLTEARNDKLRKQAP